MSKLTHIIAVGAALSVATLLAAAPPAQPIVTGDAVIDSPVGPLHVELSLIELPNGTLNGYARQESLDTGGFNVVDLTSQMLFGETLCVGGPITEAVDSPFPVGFMVVFCIEDNGNGGSGSPDRIARAFAPFPPGTTIQDIVALFPGFLPGPSSVFDPITSGNLKIH